MKEFRQVIPEGMEARIENGEVIYTPIEENKCPFEVGDLVEWRGINIRVFEGTDEDNTLWSSHCLNIKTGEFTIHDKDWMDSVDAYTKATPEQEALFNQKCLENGFWFDREKKKWIELKEGEIYALNGKALEKICVFQSVVRECFNVYVLFDSISLDYCGNGMHLPTIKNISEATEEQKKQLFDALEKEGKQWNAEKKCVEDLKWKPEMGELYWCVNDSLKVCVTTHHNGENSHGRVAIANCFKTQEDAEKYAEYMRECSLKYKEN